jgi:hypothetical protein
MNTINLFKFNIKEEDKNIILIMNEISQKTDIIFSLYTNTYELTKINKRFAILPTHMAKYSKNTTLCWDMMSIDMVINFPGPRKIVYLLQDMPWTKNTNIKYSAWNRIFEHNRLNLISTSKEHKEILELTWLKKSVMTENTEELANAISKFI